MNKKMYHTAQKTIVSCLALMAMPMMTMAQEIDHTFDFVDEAGNVVADGSVITVNTVEDDGMDLLLRVPLAVKANGATEKGGTIKVDATQMPNGSFQICSFGNCISKPKACVFNSSKGLLNNATKKSIAAEWIPTGEGTWTASLQLQVVEPEYDDLTEDYTYDKVIADGPKVTVNFEYGKTAGIHDAFSSTVSKPVAYFNLSGQRLSGAQKGITIVRCQDGKSYKINK